ncbi:MarR family winged helix-turn-helix transcriptional regulator [Shewanella phaeophyticola]|uniref:MarR family transcriptional regulator n=1 Tax=Shewanella phaeophyticola TaxID=2978345 RepID=A0ABT2P4F4_9GAMM|nr:MarR family transcriptional regulator [Shewanella sp. KJ10-1]MCT8987540.1 MarR family transcriptional regulator [Shewanella sp. KJ10-1]
MNEHPPIRLNNQFCFAVYSTSLAIIQLYKPLLESIGLTYTQYLVMLILWEQDGLSLKSVATQLGQQSGALTPVIKRLESDGLLKRVRTPNDERRLCLQLTDLEAERNNHKHNRYITVLLSNAVSVLTRWISSNYC